MNRVQDKVIVVTGGALGIGRSACILLAREGAKIAITDINHIAGKQLAEEIKQDNGTAEFWLMDISHEQEVCNTFKSIAKKFGKIDVLVNNAGIVGINQPTDEITEKEWDFVMNTNVKGTFFCTKHVIPYMRKQNKGSIINLSSVYGLVSGPDMPPYHAAKGALTLMTKTDALIYAKDKIRVNSIHPGCIWSPMVEKLVEESKESKEDFIAAMSAVHPLGHIGEPDDVGYGIVYLASDESKFVTGSALIIDGGFTAK